MLWMRKCSFIKFISKWWSPIEIVTFLWTTEELVRYTWSCLTMRLLRKRGEDLASLCTLKWLGIRLQRLIQFIMVIKLPCARLLVISSSSYYWDIIDNLAKSYMKRRETRYSYQFMQGGNNQDDQNAKASNSLQASIKSTIVPKVPKPKWLNKLGST